MATIVNVRVQKAECLSEKILAGVLDNGKMTAGVFDTPFEADFEVGDGAIVMIREATSADLAGVEIVVEKTT